MAAISTSTIDSPIITLNTATTINAKLTPSTFPQWRAQFEVIGDGSGLPVSHIGSLSIASPNRVFQLRNTLCVPTIQKNLISVHHFTKHNNVYIEFHPTYFLVKDRITGATLLKGDCEDGV